MLRNDQEPKWGSARGGFTPADPWASKVCSRPSGSYAGRAMRPPISLPIAAKVSSINRCHSMPPRCLNVAPPPSRQTQIPGPIDVISPPTILCLTETFLHFSFLPSSAPEEGQSFWVMFFIIFFWLQLYTPEWAVISADNTQIKKHYTNKHLQTKKSIKTIDVITENLIWLIIIPELDNVFLWARKENQIFGYSSGFYWMLSPKSLCVCVYLWHIHASILSPDSENLFSSYNCFDVGRIPL